MRIKTKKQFKDRIDSAFETQRTRDEAKACYDFQREEFKAADEVFGKLTGVANVSVIAPT